MAPSILKPVVVAGAATGIYAWLLKNPPKLLVAHRVVDAATGKGVSGVRLSAVRINTEDAFSVVTTNLLGGYSFGPIPEEEFGIMVDGTSVGYEKGWAQGVSTSAQVVPTWGEASSWGPAPTVIRLDKVT